MRELVYLAPYLGINLVDGVLSDAEITRIYAEQGDYVDNPHPFYRERETWIHLFEVARVSIANGTAADVPNARVAASAHLSSPKPVAACRAWITSGTGGKSAGLPAYRRKSAAQGGFAAATASPHAPGHPIGGDANRPRSR